ncbi:hypothetical protein D3C86_1915450 [compost metagenome]
MIGKNKAIAEIGSLGHCLHPLVGIVTGLSLNKQVSVSLVMRATNPSPQLMQLCQSQALRIVNKDGVGSRDIYASLNDCGANQNIKPVIIKISHNKLKVVFVHLTVCNTHP